MYKFKKHRREITKYFPIRGSYASVSGDESSLVLENPLNTRLRRFEIQGKTEQEPSPTLDSPKEIRSCGDNALGVNIRGINLFDENLLFRFSSGSPDGAFKVDEGYEFIGYPVLYYDSLVNFFKRTIKPNVDYTFVTKLKSYGKSAAGTIYVNGINPRIIAIHASNNVRITNFNLTQEDIDGIKSVYIYGTTVEGLSSGASRTIFEYIQLVEGKYTKDDFPPYEKYIEPMNVTLTSDFRFGGIDGYNDTLIVDGAGKAVEYTKKVQISRVSDLIDSENSTIYSSNGAYAIEIRGLKPWIGNADGVEANYYCSHCPSYYQLSEFGTDMFCELITYGYNDTRLWLYNIPSDTVQGAKAFADENNITIAYVLRNEEKEILSSSDLGKELLSLKPPEKSTAIIDIDCTVTPNNVSAIYSSYINEDACTLLIHFKNSQGQTLGETASYSVRRGSIYHIKSPQIDGYIAQKNDTFGCISQDTEITLIYSKK